MVARHTRQRKISVILIFSGKKYLVSRNEKASRIHGITIMIYCNASCRRPVHRQANDLVIPHAGHGKPVMITSGQIL